MTLCPRARYTGKSGRRFLTSLDPAVQEIARMVVAGIDKNWNIHPRYKQYVRFCGREGARQLIEEAVDIPGACDVIQTDPGLGGCGLFGGLGDNRRRFVFYEWTDVTPRLRISMTRKEARDIVTGKKKIVHFLPVTKAHRRARKRMERIYQGRTGRAWERQEKKRMEALLRALKHVSDR